MKKLLKFIYSYCRIWVSLLFGLGVFLYSNINSYEKETTMSIVRLTALISSIFSGILMAYLTAFSIQKRRERVNDLPEINLLSQKLINAFKIINILM